jgi:hypothetical protein
MMGSVGSGLHHGYLVIPTSCVHVCVCVCVYDVMVASDLRARFNHFMVLAEELVGGTNAAALLYGMGSCATVKEVSSSVCLSVYLSACRPAYLSARHSVAGGGVVAITATLCACRRIC